MLRLADHAWLLDRTGALHTGPPEQLIADGGRRRGIRRRQRHLHRATGSFTLRPGDGRVTIQVYGEPATAALAARLLARTGWNPLPSAVADADVDADLDTGPAGFRVRQALASLDVPCWSELHGGPATGSRTRAGASAVAAA